MHALVYMLICYVATIDLKLQVFDVSKCLLCRGSQPFLFWRSHALDSLLGKLCLLFLNLNCMHRVTKNPKRLGCVHLKLLISDKLSALQVLQCS